MLKTVETRYIDRETPAMVPENCARPCLRGTTPGYGDGMSRMWRWQWGSVSTVAARIHHWLLPLDLAAAGDGRMSGTQRNR